MTAPETKTPETTPAHDPKTVSDQKTTPEKKDNDSLAHLKRVEVLLTKIATDHSEVRKERVDMRKDFAHARDDIKALISRIDALEDRMSLISAQWNRGTNILLINACLVALLAVAVVLF
ncbi:hypothetical protein CCP2SC5_260003 [Azospirillaceae bacterium]